MKKPLTDEDLLERAAIDGRVAFAMSAFVLAATLVALLDRVGVPEGVVGVLGPVLALGGLALIGLLMHAVRVSRFYAAGRAVPAPYAGLAFTALSAGLFLPFLPPLGGGVSLTGLASGFVGGFAVAAFVTGPLLRKTGAFSIPDMLASRFPHVGVRLGVVAVVAGAALLIAIAGFESAVRGLELALAAQRLYAALIVGFVLALMLTPGGMGGVVWTATGAAGMMLAGLGLPLLVSLFGGEALPAPVIGDADRYHAALARLVQWHGPVDAGYGGAMLVIAMTLGVATLAPLLSPATTAFDSSVARRAGLSSMIWSAIIVALIALSMTMATFALDAALVGSRPDRLPAFVYAASGAGLLKICGAAVATPEEALSACRAATGFAGLVLRPGQFTPAGLWLVLGLPELRGFSIAFAGLIAAGVIAVAMVLAAAGVQALATAIGHDALYRVRDSAAGASRRLALTRMAGLGALALIVAVVAQRHVDPRIDPRALIGLALMFSAAGIAPLMALALWPRATGADAAVALLVGLASAGAMTAVGGAAASIAWLSTSAVVAAALAFLAGLTMSFMHSTGLATEGSVFVHGVLHGDDGVLEPDKGS